MPLKFNTWRLDVQKEMQKEVLNYLENMLRKDRRVLLVGDLNCKHVNWEKMDAVTFWGGSVTTGNGKHIGPMGEGLYKIYRGRRTINTGFGIHKNWSLVQPSNITTQWEKVIVWS